MVRRQFVVSQLRESGDSMMKRRSEKPDDLRPEYDFSKLGPAVRGKYYKRMVGRPIIVELRPDPDAPKPKKQKRTTRRRARSK